MKKIYSKPEIQVVMVQQHNDLLAGSAKFQNIDFNSFENQDEDLEFDFDGFDDEDIDL